MRLTKENPLQWNSRGRIELEQQDGGTKVCHVEVWCCGYVARSPIKLLKKLWICSKDLNPMTCLLTTKVHSNILSFEVLILEYEIMDITSYLVDVEIYKGGQAREIYYFIYLKFGIYIKRRIMACSTCHKCKTKLMSHENGCLCPHPPVNSYLSPMVNVWRLQHVRHTNLLETYSCCLQVRLQLETYSLSIFTISIRQKTEKAFGLPYVLSAAEILNESFVYGDIDR